MSFQAYLTNIQAKTGKSPADFRALAEKNGFTQNGKLAPGVKAGAIGKWLKADFQLGPAITGRTAGPTWRRFQRHSHWRLPVPHIKIAMFVARDFVIRHCHFLGWPDL